MKAPVAVKIFTKSGKELIEESISLAARTLGVSFSKITSCAKEKRPIVVPGQKEEFYVEILNTSKSEEEETVTNREVEEEVITGEPKTEEVICKSCRHCKFIFKTGNGTRKISCDLVSMSREALYQDILEYCRDFKQKLVEKSETEEAEPVKATSALVIDRPKKKYPERCCNKCGNALVAENGLTCKVTCDGVRNEDCCDKYVAGKPYGDRC